MTHETYTPGIAPSAHSASVDLPMVEVWTEGGRPPERRHPNTTNNRTELMPAVIALEYITGRRRIFMRLDSA